jgi:hypothetical protein
MSLQSSVSAYQLPPGASYRAAPLSTGCVRVQHDQLPRTWLLPGGIALDDPITVLAALEAFVGLVIEVSFIATFTQRFFAR